MKVRLNGANQDHNGGSTEMVHVSVVEALLKRIEALEKSKPASTDITADLQAIVEDAIPSEFQPLSYEPTKTFLDSVWGNITRHNIKVMADGRQWVVHSLTGKVMERKEANPFKDQKGNIMWIGKSEVLSKLDRPTLHIWNNPTHATV